MTDLSLNYKIKLLNFFKIWRTWLWSHYFVSYKLCTVSGSCLVNICNQVTARLSYRTLVLVYRTQIPSLAGMQEGVGNGAVLVIIDLAC